MRFKNDKQAREFLDGYESWPNVISINLMDRRVHSIYLGKALILAEDQKYLIPAYLLLPEREAWGSVNYYIIPNGEKMGKPMSSYRVSITEAVKMIRMIDKNSEEY